MLGHKLREILGALLPNVGSRAGGLTAPEMSKVRPPSRTLVRVRIRARTSQAAHDRAMTMVATSGVVAQALQYVPITLWFAVFAAVTGICRQDGARVFLGRYVQMSLIETNSRNEWRPQAMSHLMRGLGEAAREWMAEYGGLKVDCKLVESEVREVHAGGAWKFTYA